jgi:enamine deaminase RidA (YjgF/YER057c/UK114 family)
MNPEQRLVQLGLQLPSGVVAAASYAPGVLHGGVLHLSGQIPRKGSVVACTGKVGIDVPIEIARDAARLAALRLLAVTRDMAGNLDSVEQVLDLTVYVNAPPDFTEPSVVADGASELLEQVFGDRGRHARTAVCVSQLPKNAVVEISARIAIVPRAVG